ncbi:Hypothetical_protein [Hexamita inflata]|uniref:Hypothetical_protein n=1 Tax=Hexamita inflata TaxID=28002 RepID=A0AA86TZT4_9EUKA|nr:Hypothetical protein HINF_LOCUS20822 [Hexamita inflata]
MNNMDSVFRINMLRQLKRYDRCYQFFISAFVMFFVVCFFYINSYFLNLKRSVQFELQKVPFLNRYCADVLGLGFYILYFRKFLKLKLQNADQQAQPQKEPSKLILQEMQPIDHISRHISGNDSTENEINIQNTSKINQNIQNNAVVQIANEPPRIIFRHTQSQFSRKTSVTENIESSKEQQNSKYDLVQSQQDKLIQQKVDVI